MMTRRHLLLLPLATASSACGVRPPVPVATVQIAIPETRLEAFMIRLRRVADAQGLRLWLQDSHGLTVATLEGRGLFVALDEVDFGRLYRLTFSATSRWPLGAPRNRVENLRSALVSALRDLPDVHVQTLQWHHES